MGGLLTVSFARKEEDSGLSKRCYCRNMDDPVEAISTLLREQHGIRQAMLQPSARLAHDLGVDGDDMSELLQHPVSYTHLTLPTNREV